VSHSDDRSIWTDEIPTIHDLYQYGGRPGCEYLYCDLAHLIEATQAGWRKIPKAPTFRLIGPKGTGDFELLERGEVAITINPLASAQPVSISEYLCEATGLGLSGEFTKIPVTTPSTVPPAPPLGQPARVTKEAHSNA
jgi:hypothetical protein